MLLAADIAGTAGCVHTRETLPVERLRDGKPVCMAMYKAMFNSCRVPAPVEDTFVTHRTRSTHVLVVRKNKFFTFDVGCPHTRCSVEQIERYAHLRAVPWRRV